MPKYEITDFYYERYGDEIFKDKEKLKKKILSDDSKGTAKLWIEHPTDWYTQEGSEGSVLKEKVDTVNSDYIKNVSEQIERANTEEELDVISVDEEYQEGTVTELNGVLAAKKEELFAPITVEIEGEEFEIPSKFVAGRPKAMISEEVRATSGEILEEIVTAGVENDLESLRAIEIENLPGKLKRFLEREKKETMAAVEEELEVG